MLRESDHPAIDLSRKESSRDAQGRTRVCLLPHGWGRASCCGPPKGGVLICASPHGPLQSPCSRDATMCAMQLATATGACGLAGDRAFVLAVVLPAVLHVWAQVLGDGFASCIGARAVKMARHSDQLFPPVSASLQPPSPNSSCPFTYAHVAYMPPRAMRQFFALRLPVIWEGAPVHVFIVQGQRFGLPPAIDIQPFFFSTGASDGKRSGHTRTVVHAHMAGSSSVQVKPPRALSQRIHWAAHSQPLTNRPDLVLPRCATVPCMMKQLVVYPQN
uniref:Uncharacterized protein n=1 Tax=Eutreptiella gymnastica TaxID=73025 RepID=A0A7S4FX98_9EUGL